MGRMEGGSSQGGREGGLVAYGAPWCPGPGLSEVGGWWSTSMHWDELVTGWGLQSTETWPKEWWGQEGEGMGQGGLSGERGIQGGTSNEAG